MKQPDYLLKIVDRDQQVRIFLSHTSNLVDEACRRHQTSATASAALGRVLTAAVMMGSDLKGENDIVTLKFDGQGPAGVIMATAGADGGVRGLISNPQADLPSRSPGKLAVGELVGRDGYVQVIKDLGLKHPFVGQVPIHSGEIADDLAHYYLESEQIPSLVSLGVLVAPDLSIQSAGGLIIQALPGARDEVLLQLEDQVLDMGSISHVLDQATDLEDVAQQIMGDIEYTVLDRMELRFSCLCSRDRLGRILLSMAPEEIASYLEEDGKIEVVCRFCNEHYIFLEEDLALQRQKMQANEKP